MPRLVVLTGPIASGKNTVADRLSDLLAERGRTVVIVDVDDVAAAAPAPFRRAEWRDSFDRTLPPFGPY